MKRKYILIALPEGLRLRFKVACARRGKSMRAVLRAFMAEYSCGSVGSRELKLVA
jgi:hypothetical protein